MKKSWIVLLVLIISLFFIIFVSAEVRINEVELNPNDGCNDCTEWVELYSEHEINLNGWKIRDASNKNFSLNFSFEGYYILKDLSISLNNANEKLFLYNGSYLVFETPLISDSNNDDKTWQYCSNNWRFTYMTKNSENNCSISQNNPPQNNQTQNTEQPSDSRIFLKIEFDEDEIINGEEFKIKIKTYNLKNQYYNFKIWIKQEDEEIIISDRYGEDSKEDEIWKSGNYYIYNLFKGPGNETKTVELRIRESYENFFGDAEICFKIEGISESEDCEDIEVLEKEQPININDTEEIQTITQSSKKGNFSETSNFISGEVIKLGSSESKETENPKNTESINNNTIYESKNEKMKKYAIIGFAVLCLGLVILVLFKKIN